MVGRANQGSIRYTAFIYERVDGAFDIDILRTTGPVEPSGQSMDGTNRVGVHSVVTESTKSVSLHTISKYILWKFEHCQWDNRVIITDGHCSFAQVNNNLPWIISIIIAEFDYHVGLQNCMKDENKKAMRTYTSSRTSGWCGSTLSGNT